MIFNVLFTYDWSSSFPHNNVLDNQQQVWVIKIHSHSVLLQEHERSLNLSHDGTWKCERSPDIHFSPLAYIHFAMTLSCRQTAETELSASLYPSLMSLHHPHPHTLSSSILIFHLHPPVILAPIHMPSITHRQETRARKRLRCLNGESECHPIYTNIQRKN